MFFFQKLSSITPCCAIGRNGKTLEVFMATQILKTLSQMADSQPGLPYNSLRWDIQKRKQALIEKAALFRRGLPTASSWVELYSGSSTSGLVK